jgi:hypothetical protein
VLFQVIDQRSQQVIEQGDNDIDMIDLATNKINETQNLLQHLFMV